MKEYVIKYNANQKYCTDGISAAMFKDICKQVDVPYQTFTNRSDMAGGSTLGNISNTQVALNTVDIGLPQLAMHSPYETAGVKDTEYLLKAAKAFLHRSLTQSRLLKKYAWIFLFFLAFFCFVRFQKQEKPARNITESAPTPRFTLPVIWLTADTRMVPIKEAPFPQIS